MVVRSTPPTECGGVWACPSQDTGGLDSDDGAAGAGQKGNESGNERVPALGQRRRGAAHGAGGRRRGTGKKETRATLKEGSKRAVATHLTRPGVHKWLDGLRDSPNNDQRVAVVRFLDESLDGACGGEVTAMEAFVGAVARMSDADYHAYNGPGLVRCWVASRGNVVCTCVQRARYETMLDAKTASVPDTQCYHAPVGLDGSTAVLDCHDGFQTRAQARGRNHPTAPTG